MTSLLVATGAVALTIWALALVLVRETARARRPDPPWRAFDPLAGPLAEPGDPALVRVLAAVRQHPGGDHLRDALVGAALEGLLEREIVVVENRRGELWAVVADQPVAASADLAPHERLLLDHVRVASARAAGPLPLAALRPDKGVDADRVWLTDLVEAAVGWARTGRYLRDLLPSSSRARGWLRAALLVPAGSLLGAALAATGPSGETTMASIIAGAVVWWGAGTVLTSPLIGHGLTSVGAAALAAPAARAAAPPRPLADRIARLLTTNGRRDRAWSPADERWREARVGNAPTAWQGDDPRSVLRGALLLLGALAVVVVVLLRVTPGMLRTSEPFTLLLVASWWAALLVVTPRPLRRLARAAADLRTGPLTCTGPVVQRRFVDAEGDTAASVPVVVVDVGDGVLRSFAVGRTLFDQLAPGTWVRAVVTPRLHHLVSIEPLRAPGGVGLPRHGDEA